MIEVNNFELSNGDILKITADDEFYSIYLSQTPDKYLLDTQSHYIDSLYILIWLDFSEAYIMYEEDKEFIRIPWILNDNNLQVIKDYIDKVYKSA